MVFINGLAFSQNTLKKQTKTTTTTKTKLDPHRKVSRHHGVPYFQTPKVPSRPAP